MPNQSTVVQAEERQGMAGTINNYKYQSNGLDMILYVLF